MAAPLKRVVITACLALAGCAAGDIRPRPAPPEVRDTIEAGPSQTYDGLLVLGTEALFTPSEFYLTAAKMAHGKNDPVSLPGWWLNIGSADQTLLAAAIAQGRKKRLATRDMVFRVRVTGALDPLSRDSTRVFHVRGILAATLCRKGSLNLDTC